MLGVDEGGKEYKSAEGYGGNAEHDEISPE
jgi:hypothetical protein